MCIEVIAQNVIVVFFETQCIASVCLCSKMFYIIIHFSIFSFTDVSCWTLNKYWQGLHFSTFFGYLKNALVQSQENMIIFYCLHSSRTLFCKNTSSEWKALPPSQLFDLLKCLKFCISVASLSVFSCQFLDSRKGYNKRFRYPSVHFQVG